MDKGRPATPRTQELIQTICDRVTEGWLVVDIARGLKISSKYVTAVRQYFLQLGKVPPLHFTPIASVTIRVNGMKPFQPNARTFPFDEAKAHVAELREAALLAEQRRLAKLAPVTPVAKSDFIRPLTRQELMAGSARTRPWL